MAKYSSKDETFTCPNCGAEVSVRAKVCPECGADEEAGWNFEEAQSALHSADDDFDYNEYVEKEFGKKVKPTGVKLWVWLVAMVLLGLTILGIVAFEMLWRNGSVD